MGLGEMYPGTMTNGNLGGSYVVGTQIATGGDFDWNYSTVPVWFADSINARYPVKKPFCLADFVANKGKITEAWHEAFRAELLRWRWESMRQLGEVNRAVHRTVEYVVRTWLSVDWRWVFKKWVQDLYAEA